MRKIFIRVLLILIIVAILGFYIYDLIENHTAPSKNLFRTISIVCLCSAGLIRSFGSRGRRSLDFYESQYPDILQNAFADQPLWKKKLLCAVRLYNENNYGKAIKYLTDLKTRVRYAEDSYAVYLFAALCFTDAQLYEQAEHIYKQLINAEISNSRIFSNLGHVQMKIGEHKNALTNYKFALDFDPQNAITYNNIAQAYFQMHEFENAIINAKKALEINSKTHQAAVLLAIVYSLEGDAENSEKYFHIAISSGRDPKEIKDTIEFYRSAKNVANNEFETSE